MNNVAFAFRAAGSDEEISFFGLGVDTEALERDLCDPTATLIFAMEKGIRIAIPVKGIMYAKWVAVPEVSE